MLTGLNAIEDVGTFKQSATTAAGGDMVLYGPADFGNWTILTAAGAATDTTIDVAVDLNLLDVALCNLSNSSNDFSYCIRNYLFEFK